MRFLCILIPIGFFSQLCFAQPQQVFKLSFKPVFGNENLKPDTIYHKLNKTDSISIETLRFYISGIELWNNGAKVWKEKNSFHFIDAAETKSLVIQFKIPANIFFQKIKFNLGIDSVTNASGAMEGDLDPTKGMYWAWQSGYINFKLEGKSALCKTRNHQFQFHLGGFMFPFNALRTITLDVNDLKHTDIAVDIAKFISSIELWRQNEIMSPGKEAMLITDKAAKIFSTSK